MRVGFKKLKIQFACSVLTAIVCSSCMSSSSSALSANSVNSSNYGTTVNFTVTPASASVNPGATYQFTASGGTPPYSYSILNGGGSISSSGQFTAPTIQASVSILVQDSSNPVNSFYASASIISTAITLTAASSTLATYGTDQFTASGGSGNYTYALLSGSIGTISSSTGLYTAPSTEGYAEVSVTDSAGDVAYSEVLVNSVGTPSTATATGFESNVSSTFTVLATYNSGCTYSAPYSLTCSSAINRYCQSVKSAVSGFGPTNYSGNNVSFTCVTSGAATLLYAEPEILDEYNSLCTTKNLQGVQCLSAINRYCSSLGFVSGFGPVEVQGTSATSLVEAVCVNSAAATIVNDNFGDLEAYSSGCNVEYPSSFSCMYSTAQYCQSSGYTSGFGIIEDTISTASWVCLN